MEGAGVGGGRSPLLEGPQVFPLPRDPGGTGPKSFPPPNSREGIRRPLKSLLRGSGVGD